MDSFIVRVFRPASGDASGDASVHGLHGVLIHPSSHREIPFRSSDELVAIIEAAAGRDGQIAMTLPRPPIEAVRSTRAHTNDSSRSPR
jgi:hypothetical protein